MNFTPSLEIILVEDNMNDAELTIRALKKNKIVNNIVHLKDGKDAIDYLFSQGAYADKELKLNASLILLDLKMPGMSGIEVLTKIKSNEHTKLLPVVVLTSSKESPDIEECYRLGVNSYIVKPVEIENFSKAVTQIGIYWLLLNQPPVA
ncbi:MAG: response regulator [Ferruginibacter sp.]